MPFYIVFLKIAFIIYLGMAVGRPNYELPVEVENTSINIRLPEKTKFKITEVRINAPTRSSLAVLGSLPYI
jgi:hypothetical protein